MIVHRVPSSQHSCTLSVLDVSNLCTLFFYRDCMQGPQFTAQLHSVSALDVSNLCMLVARDIKLQTRSASQQVRVKAAAHAALHAAL